MQTFKINTDGGARGNPGPAGIGARIEIRDSLPAGEAGEIRDIKEISEYIGEATNNQAEYRAVIKALEWVNDNFFGADIKIEFLLDSQLVVEQLNGNYKMKNEGLKPLFWQIRELVVKLGGNVSFKYVPREQNKEADRLVNLAIDEHLSVNQK